jgi:dTDP-4-amino-4,6-dideoxygalactose transaminase
MSESALAILGGKPAVTLAEPEDCYVGEPVAEAVVTAVREGTRDWRYLSSIAGGGPVGAFEKRFASYLGVRHALGLSSCTAALHTALIVCSVRTGDEVIVSPYTWGQSVSPILFVGATPVFADIDPLTYNLDPASVVSRVTAKTKAIIVVHIFGHPAAMDKLMAVACQHGLAIIEDCAQATGATYRGQKVGTLGDVGCFSLGYGKALSGGEGGVLVTDDDAIHERAVLLTQHPLRQAQDVRDPGLRPMADSLGYNYRMHPLAAVIAGAQLETLDSRNAARRAAFESLSSRLTGIPGIQPVAVRPGCEHVFHRYSPTFVPEEVKGLPRETYVQALVAEGVPISLGPIGTPIHRRQSFRKWHRIYANHRRHRSHRAGNDECVVAEHRCAEAELALGSRTAPVPWGDLLIEQVRRGFEKVADNAAALAAWRGAPTSATRRLR